MKWAFAAGGVWSVIVAALMGAFERVPGCDYRDFVAVVIGLAATFTLVGVSCAVALSARRRGRPTAPWVATAVLILLGAMLGAAAGARIADARATHDVCQSN